MSTNESNHLEFRGRDLNECERFIAAVNKHAHAQGKLWDDQWIAEFVAVCLAGDALISWSLLDEESQKSWRLLRQSMIFRFLPPFYGKSGAEAEEFVYQIRQRAFQVGKHKDPHWAAELASGCFAGSALRWYMSLDSGIRDDWVLLQQAIFRCYSQGFDENSSVQIMSTPAFAATASVPTKQRHRGRIRVSRKDDSGTYYLSKIPGSGLPNQYEPGRINATSVVAEALEVEYKLTSSSDGLQALSIPDDQIKGCNMLGMKWYRPDTTDVNNLLVACGLDSISGIGYPAQGYVGPLLPMPWKIFSSANEQGAKSVIAICGSGQRLFSVSNTSHRLHIWYRLMKATDEVYVDLLFEPV